MKHSIYLLSALIASILAISSCSEDDAPPVADPVASFQYEPGTGTDYNTVTFTNFSQNYETASWDFGDGNTSTEDNPVHTYAEDGTYTVTLTVASSTGVTATRSDEVEISDPNAKLTLLAGTESKTWKLVREGTSMFLASGQDPTGADYAVYWPGLQNDGSRPCLYEHTFTFTRDGNYVFDDMGAMWAEYGIFNGAVPEGCDNITAEQCLDATPANMVNACSDDVSAWLGATHAYTYDPVTNEITLTGDGAWIGIPKLTTAGESIVPVSEVTFDGTVIDGGESGVDTLLAEFIYDGAYWSFTYVSYNDPALEPDLTSVKANFAASANGLTVTFENRSSAATSYSWDFGDGNTSTEESPVHTYAAAGTYTVTLTASDGGSSTTVSKEVTVSEVALTEAAPAPTQAGADVISVYSDAYTDITGVDTNPNWGQATAVTEETVQSDNVLLLSSLNYQGIDFAGNPQDVSGMTNVHLDIWSAEEITINFSLISPGPLETPYSITTNAGTWTSVDIPLTEYSSVVNLTEVFQMKFDDAGSGTSPSFYVDNIYFY